LSCKQCTVMTQATLLQGACAPCSNDLTRVREPIIDPTSPWHKHLSSSIPMHFDSIRDHHSSMLVLFCQGTAKAYPRYIVTLCPRDGTPALRPGSAGETPKPPAASSFARHAPAPAPPYAPVRYASRASMFGAAPPPASGAAASGVAGSLLALAASVPSQPLPPLLPLLEASRRRRYRAAVRQLPPATSGGFAAAAQPAADLHAAAAFSHTGATAAVQQGPESFTIAPVADVDEAAGQEAEGPAGADAEGEGASALRRSWWQ
jgi:hypothetical protein